MDTSGPTPDCKSDPSMASKTFLNLAKKVVIITGASAGIGEATALEFARQGCRLMLCGRDKTRLETVAEQCRKLDGSVCQPQVKTTVGDVNEDAVQKTIIDETVSSFGALDVLVNNAGVLKIADPLTTTREDYRKIMDTNLESLFFLTQKAVPHLEKTKGSIVNVSSIVSATVAPKIMVYSMSKAALDNLTEGLALTLASKGIRVNSVNPGTIGSKLYRDELSEEGYQEFLKNQNDACVHPLGRTGKPSEVADAIVYLASERASFITGQALFVAGGRQCVGPVPALR